MGNNNADIKTLEQLYAIICEQPGMTIYDLSKATGLCWASIQARLTTMGNHGFMLSESPQAGLYPFDGDINLFLGEIRSMAGLR